ncbi:hypothetical protein SprV_0200713800 [Sparganum proliferum]
MRQSPPNAACSAARIRLNGIRLKTADNFAYSDNRPSRCIKIDDNVVLRISKASRNFGRLHNLVWNRHGLHRNIQLKMYKAAILTTLLYGAETWTVSEEQAWELDLFYRILKLTWQVRIPDTDVPERAGILSIAKRSE